jgi:hypothetical protein
MHHDTCDPIMEKSTKTSTRCGGPPHDQKYTDALRLEGCLQARRKTSHKRTYLGTWSKVLDPFPLRVWLSRLAVASRPTGPELPPNLDGCPRKTPCRALCTKDMELLIISKCHETVSMSGKLMMCRSTGATSLSAATRRRPYLWQPVQHLSASNKRDGQTMTMHHWHT